MTLPIEYRLCSSKIGFQVTPALLVFHTPPEPTATYQTLRSWGCQAISAMRPDIKAGPILRHFRPARDDSSSATPFDAMLSPSKVAHKTKNRERNGVIKLSSRSQWVGMQWPNRKVGGRPVENDSLFWCVVFWCMPSRLPSKIHRDSTPGLQCRAVIRRSIECLISAVGAG